MNQVKKAKKIYSPEQKVAILNQIENLIKQGMLLQEALEKQGVAYSNYYKWKKQLAVGIKSSLRNGKPPVNHELKKLEKEVDSLKAIVLSQAQAIADLKKETNWD